MRYAINRAAVVGAGMMGAAIASHIANAGIPVYLLDIVPDRLTPEEEARGLTLAHPAVRNRIVNAGLERAKRSSPPSFFSADTAQLVTTGNIEDNLAWLGEADWIIEAVLENLEVKRAMMERIEGARKPGSIVSTNTSGISINAIAAGRSDDFRAHFLGAHFFNPPRWMKLLEITPNVDTSPEVLSFMAQFGERTMGKGVVICKDTPNFIANRLATANGFNIGYAIEMGYTVEEVDSITGPLIGRPRTGTFRLMDLVGLDIAGNVSQNLSQGGRSDATSDVPVSQKMMTVFQAMLEKNWLGNKTGQGFYKTVQKEDGSREFWAINLETLEYEPPKAVRFESVGKVRNIEPLPQRLKALVNEDDRAGKYVWAITSWEMAYASRRIPEITESPAAIDKAVKWGFARELGPFEAWDALGVAEALKRMEADGEKVAPWVEEMLASGHSTFYQYEDGRQVGCYDVATKEYRRLPESPNIISLSSLKSRGKEIKGNASASLIDLGDGVACLEFHSKMNTFDPDIVEMINFAVEEADRNYLGLVIGNQGEQFSAGANVAQGGGQLGGFDAIEGAIKAMQDAFMALRYSPRPVVVAPFGMALGGGAECVMAGARVCAAAELNIGQVEAGIGLVPSAGGCKELLRRVVSPAMKTPGSSPLPYLQRVFQAISTAKVSMSAIEARETGFLTDADRIIMNRDHLLGEAKRLVLELVAADYRPPVRLKNVYAAGRDALSTLYAVIYGMEAAGYASEHDAKIARKLAYVLCGGDLSEGQWVDEQHILDLEREAFLSLLGEPKTLQRIMHMLQTGRPLRN